jgi:hypothetical protein
LTQQRIGIKSDGRHEIIELLGRSHGLRTCLGLLRERGRHRAEKS